MKILIVDDSPFMRRVLTDMITQIGHDVVGTAKNGKEAVEMVKSLKPDVVTLDVEMPIMDGLTALEIIMRESPLPVLMLSTLTEAGAKETLKALEIGAVDFMTKPTSLFKVSTTENIRELSYKLAAARYSKVVKRVTPSFARASLGKSVLDKASSASLVQSSVAPTSKTMAKSLSGGSVEPFKKLVAIGISTGGPMSLQEVIPKIPASIDAAIVVVQHMPPSFTKSLADRLDSMSQVHVVEASDGESLKKGVVYIAPGDRHLKIVNKFGKFVVQLNDGDKEGGHRPSVDVMMNSVSDLSYPSVGVIMTGMGSDGTRGLKRMKMTGSYVLAQDEASSVVFGMPRSAINAGVVDKVVGLSSIADEIKNAVEV